MSTVKENILIAIHQPNYLPWLGYFYKIYQADIFVFLDDAQFSNQGMHNYTYIKTAAGSYRLKYPVHQSLGDKINEVRSKDELRWKEKHLSILELNYHDAKYFDEVFSDYRSIISIDYSDITALNIALIEFFAGRLGLNSRFEKSPGLYSNLAKSEKIIAICKGLGGNVYYSGTGAKSYQKEEDFISSGIELRYSVFRPFQYPQLWNGFQSNVTALDFFMNCGYDWDRVLKNQEQY
jgi:hypothetical protein